MRRAHLLSAFVVLACAGLAVWSLSRPGEDLLGAARTVVDEGGGDSAPAKSELGTASRALAREGLAPSKPGTPSTIESLPQGIAVRVVDGRTRSGVGAARVWVGTLATLGAERDAIRAGTDALEGGLGALLRQPAAAVADGRGETTLVALPSANPVLVLAADGADSAVPERLGWRLLDRSEHEAGAPFEVTIDARQTLAIVVRDAKGRPVGAAPLRIAVPRGEGIVTLWSGPTAAGGTATIGDFTARARARLEAGRHAAADLEALAFVDAPLGVRPSCAFRVLSPPREPIELRLPDTGRVRVLLDDRGATPVRGGRVVVEEVGLPPAEQRLAPSPSVPLSKEGALFGFVGLGLTLRVLVHVDGASSPHVVEAQGPLAPDEERTIVVPLVDDRAVLVMRLHDPDGLPLAKQEFETRVGAKHGEEDSETTSTVRSDAEARVRFYREDELPDAATRRLALRHRARNLELSIEVPKPWRRGETDLGSLRLAEPPLLVSGTVVDSAGAPVPDAALSLAEDREATTKSGPDGSFAIRARCSEASPSLVVSARGYLAIPPTTFVTGTTNLVIRLVAGGVLEGEILVDRFEEPPVRSVRVRDRKNGEEASHFVWGPKFALEHLRVGVYDLTAHVAGVAGPLAKVEAIEVKPGQVTRLAPIDLRGLLRRIEFRVCDEKGAPVRDAEALMLEDAGAAANPHYEGVQISEGRGALIASKVAPSILVYAEGRLSETVTALQDGQIVTLLPALRIALQVATEELPAAPVQLLVELVPLDERFPESAMFTLRSPRSVRSMRGRMPWAPAEATVLDAKGRGESVLATRGRHRVRVTVVRSTSGPRTGVVVEGVEPAEVILTSGTATLALRVPAALLRKAVEKL